MGHDLMSGNPIEALPQDFSLWLNETDGPMEDRITMPLNWLILSNRLVEFLWPLIHDCVQVFDCPLYGNKSNKLVPGYKFVHVTRKEDCIVPERSVPSMNYKTGQRQGFIDYTVDPARTHGAHIFRYIDPPDTVDMGYTCSSKMVEALDGHGFTGLAFIRTDPDAYEDD